MTTTSVLTDPIITVNYDDDLPLFDLVKAETGIDPDLTLSLNAVSIPMAQITKRDRTRLIKDTNRVLREAGFDTRVVGA